MEVYNREVRISNVETIMHFVNEDTETGKQLKLINFQLLFQLQFMTAKLTDESRFGHVSSTKSMLFLYLHYAL